MIDHMAFCDQLWRGGTGKIAALLWQLYKAACHIQCLMIRATGILRSSQGLCTPATITSRKRMWKLPTCITNTTGVEPMAVLPNVHHCAPVQKLQSLPYRDICKTLLYPCFDRKRVQDLKQCTNVKA
ncbi:unnamed protein product [Ixodes pacificus]